MFRLLRVASPILLFTCLAVLFVFGLGPALSAQQVAQTATPGSQVSPPAAAAPTPTKLFARSETMYMNSQTLVEALRRQPELDELHLELADHQSQADILVRVKRALLTLEWSYTITETGSGREIGKGKVRTVTAEGAANVLGPLIIRDIAVSLRSRPSAPAAAAAARPVEAAPPKPAEAAAPDASALESELRSSAVPVENLDVPRPTGMVNPHAYALVIGAEKYRAPIPEVPFALNDAVVMRRYFESVLGVSAANIKGVPNPALTDLKVGLMWLRNQVFADGSPEAIAYVYYAGHGVPDINTGKPYLMPVDANPDYIRETGYAVETLVAELAALPSTGVIFLDACFTGSAARAKGSSAGVMLGKRPAFVETRLPAAPSRVSVFSGVSGSQSSNALHPARHGLFTYYLLKGFSGDGIDPQGRITLDSLQRYVTKEVSAAASRMNQMQTPSLSGPAELVLVKLAN